MVDLNKQLQYFDVKKVETFQHLKIIRTKKNQKHFSEACSVCVCV